MRALLTEIYLLLTYIQGEPEHRLTRYFGQGPQRDQERQGAPVPPTWDLPYFLGRIAAIESSGPDFKPNSVTEAGVNPATIPPNPLTTATELQAESHPPPPPPEPSQVDTGPKLTDLAFLIWTQDFLAAVAAPVTVETLLVTQSFRVARMNSWVARLGSYFRRRRSAPWARAAATLVEVPEHVGQSPPFFDPELASTTQQDTLQAYGRRLARRVAFLTWGTTAVIFFTVWSSALVYNGRVLMRENVALQVAYKDILNRITLADKDERVKLLAAFSEDGGVSTGKDPNLTAFYCEISLPPLSSPTTANGGLQVDWSQIGFGRNYLTATQGTLCSEYSRLEKRSKELKDAHGIWVANAAPFRLIMAPWSLFSKRPPNPEMRFAIMEKLDLESHRYLMEQVVDGFIGGILPVTYALLGSVAALFRTLNTRADRSLLSPADYGSIRNTLLLGVITGSVIGLFSDAIGWGTHEASALPLTSTALALLGGFATEQVFSFFESLSSQLFGRGRTSAPAAAGLKGAN